eukprot:GHVR01000812.1.p1 GENE.GHVR01000812.1~~GHVR01000812.1.p1  ORF type:complete len:203 (+),score=40.23 GHVR01000812.1:92-700(+)
MFEKELVIDARGHLVGRLASVVAKELLNGQKIVLVRCEDLNISGSLYRNRLKYQEFLRKRMTTNPKKGPFHLRSPARMMWRSLRGMLPHKLTRGKMALQRLKAYEGIPHPYTHRKRMVVPQALKVLRLKPHRRFCRLGDLSNSVGWGHDQLVKRLEERRKLTSEAYYKGRQEERKKRKEAEKSVVKSLNKEETDILMSSGCM